MQLPLGVTTRDPALIARRAAIYCCAAVTGAEGTAIDVKPGRISPTVAVAR
jgi:hypothetical protein